ncbi:hypothetical protein EYF80_041554 [Liparis tanakae]|uniref:Uncharacterized protein n=1 Tax=Liparis tanakae TaxID=230148 RepID=A0A4Z2G525_9TELE|nr:hypothetical protein EYF80_041554 [Liparis tanakae]
MRPQSSEGREQPVWLVSQDAAAPSERTKAMLVSQEYVYSTFAGVQGAGGESVAHGHSVQDAAAVGGGGGAAGRRVIPPVGDGVDRDADGVLVLDPGDHGVVGDAVQGLRVSTCDRQSKSEFTLGPHGTGQRERKKERKEDSMSRASEGMLVHTPSWWLTVGYPAAGVGGAAAEKSLIFIHDGSGVGVYFWLAAPRDQSVVGVTVQAVAHEVGGDDVRRVVGAALQALDGTRQIPGVAAVGDAVTVRRHRNVEYGAARPQPRHSDGVGSTFAHRRHVLRNARDWRRGDTFTLFPKTGGDGPHFASAALAGLVGRDDVEVVVGGRLQISHHGRGVDEGHRDRLSGVLRGHQQVVAHRRGHLDPRDLNRSTAQQAWEPISWPQTAPASQEGGREGWTDEGLGKLPEVKDEKNVDSSQLKPVKRGTGRDCEEQDSAALCSERGHHHVIHVPTLDAADVTAALPRRGGAGVVVVVVVVAAHHLCDGAVAAAIAAPVMHPMRQWGSWAWQRAWPRVDVREVMNRCAPLARDHDTLVTACVTWSTVRFPGQQGSLGKLWPEGPVAVTLTSYVEPQGRSVMSQLFPPVVQLRPPSSPDALTVYVASLLFAFQLTPTLEEFFRVSIRSVGMQGADGDEGKEERRRRSDRAHTGAVSLHRMTSDPSAARVSYTWAPREAVHVISRVSVLTREIDTPSGQQGTGRHRR